mmetsp:Transcript_20837/g.52559  ORF Transcript_20837/g.52559 Transcript_20837/m.52559 type:complete len:291 (-) Transcript_20837:824-1696(-)
MSTARRVLMSVVKLRREEQVPWSTKDARKNVMEFEQEQDEKNNKLIHIGKRKENQRAGLPLLPWTNNFSRSSAIAPQILPRARYCSCSNCLVLQRFRAACCCAVQHTQSSRPRAAQKVVRLPARPRIGPAAQRAAVSGVGRGRRGPRNRGRRSFSTRRNHFLHSRGAGSSGVTRGQLIRARRARRVRRAIILLMRSGRLFGNDVLKLVAPHRVVPQGHVDWDHPQVHRVKQAPGGKVQKALHHQPQRRQEVHLPREQHHFAAGHPRPGQGCRARQLLRGAGQLQLTRRLI